jgi:hypothetical protein
MPTRLLLALTAALLIVRLPSLVQPMGPDQGLYAYVGDRILHGELPYREAWDQKPPGIHYIYAALRAVSAKDVVVPAADLAAAASVAALLWLIGSRLCGPLAGGLSAALFLLLSDPSLARYGGFRVRAQAETFIAVAITAALALATRRAEGATRANSAEGAGAERAEGAGAERAEGAGALLLAGVLVGCGFALKYNAGLYGVIVLMGMAAVDRLTWRKAALVVAGAVIVPAILLLIFWRGGALDDLYQATVAYNLRYSGETYASRWEMARYVFVAPIRHAQLDPLWFVGGVGCVVLLVAGIRALRQGRLVSGWIPVVWVAIASVSIAINGSRDLPQYFLQAAPALALAAGMAAAIAIAPLPARARWLVILLLAAATWRVGADPFPKLAANVWHDTRYAIGRVDRRTHLARYGSRDVDKYSALDNRDLGDFLAAHTRPDETVYVFGYSSGAYVYAERRSASRFFWSRPVIVQFNSGNPAYGVHGLRTELEQRRPAYVILQQRDWPDVQNSAAFFLSQPVLADWLHAEYHEVPLIENFITWERNAR